MQISASCWRSKSNVEANAFGGSWRGGEGGGGKGGGEGYLRLLGDPIPGGNLPAGAQRERGRWRAQQNKTRDAVSRVKRLGGGTWAPGDVRGDLESLECVEKKK